MLLNTSTRSQLIAYRSFDLTLMTVFNSRDRSANDWKTLLGMADSRFEFIRSWTPKPSSKETPQGAMYGVVEARWAGKH